MALARVVTFEGVSKERVDRLTGEMRDGERPEGLPPSELMLLHDPGTETAVAIMFFDDEEAYEQGDKVLDAMPSDDTPGRRASVTKYDVAVRRTA
jgi:hypothetical protein